jgi:hypothetical protein
MTTLTIEQHFYGSAPVGLSGSRGFQTVARSKGCVSHEKLEPHCSYFRPSRKYELRPVNWGWLRLRDGRVCIHRIAYSGNDELGRPGNFFAHNLVLGPDDLEAIDYHVPLLFRWVAERSPITYPSPDGSSGFARSYSQVFERLGWDPKRLRDALRDERDQLTRIEPLRVPVDELEGFRRESDEQFRECGSELSSAPAAVVVRALLAEPPRRKPVLVLSYGDGEEGSARELRLVELLFALVPYHVRKRLTFSTYCGLRPGASAKDLPDRQLILTTRYNPEFRLESADFPVWIVDGIGSSHRLPPDSASAQRVGKLLSEGRFGDLLELRDTASDFDFGIASDRESDWVETVKRHRGPRIEIGPGKFARFHRLARLVRRGRFDVLKQARRLIKGWALLPHRDPDDARNLAAAFLSAVDRLLPAPGQESEVIISLARFFCSALDNRAWPAAVTVAEAVIGNETLRPLRGAILDRCLTRLARRPPGKARDFARWAEFSQELVSEKVSESVREELLARVAKSVGPFLLAIPAQEWPDLAPYTFVFVVPVLARLPLQSPEELAHCMRLIRKADPTQGDALGPYLTLAWQFRSLPFLLVERAFEGQRGELLPNYSAWEVLAAVEPAVQARFRSVRDDPDLFLSLWSFTPDRLDLSLLRSSAWVLRKWTLGGQTSTREALASETLRRRDELLAWFGHDYRIDDPEILAELGRVQAAWLRILRQSVEESPAVPDQQRLLPFESFVNGALCRMIAFLLTRPVSKRLESVSILETPIRLLREICREPERLTDSVVEIVHRCGDFRPERSNPGWPLLEQWTAGLRQEYKDREAPPRLTRVEIEWLTLHFESVLVGTASQSPPNPARLVAQLLSRHPELMGPPRDRFERYFGGLTENPAVWSELAAILTQDLVDGRIDRWFGNPDSERLVQRLDEFALLSCAGEQAAKSLAERESDEAADRIDKIGKHPRRNLSRFAAQVTGRKTVERAVRAFRTAGSETISLEDRCRSLLDAWKRISSIREHLPPRSIREMGECLGEAVALLPPEAITEFFHGIRDIREANRPEADDRVGPWIELLRPLAKSGDGERTRRVVVAFADALFRPQQEAGQWTLPRDPASRMNEILSAGSDRCLEPILDWESLYQSALRLPDRAYGYGYADPAILFGRARFISWWCAKSPRKVFKAIADWYTPSAAPLDRHIYLGRAVGGFLTATGCTRDAIDGQVGVLLSAAAEELISRCGALLPSALNHAHELLTRFDRDLLWEAYYPFDRLRQRFHGR